MMTPDAKGRLTNTSPTSWILILHSSCNYYSLRINPAKRDIDSFVYEDFTIEGYEPYETIKMKMAV